MKKLIVQKWSGIILSVVLISVFIFLFFYKNVVTGIDPVRDPGEKAEIALSKVAYAENKQEALSEAINQLPVNGNTLEEKVARWVQFDFSTIDSMKFKLISGVGISATSAERIVRGYTQDQVVVVIFSNGKKEEFFLMCANGLVKKRWPKAVFEKEIGETRKIEHGTTYNLTVSQDIYIPKGGSLCGTLGMTPQEALTLAKKYQLKYWYKDEIFYVLVFPNVSFHYVNNEEWRPVPF